MFGSMRTKMPSYAVALGRIEPQTKINHAWTTYTKISMLTRPERRAVGILILVILLLALLYFGTILLIPDQGAAEYRPDLPDGTLVRLEGIVFETKITATGGHLIANISGTDVFIPNGGKDPILVSGDRVKVIGKIETYAGKKEIVANGISDITILV